MVAVRVPVLFVVALGVLAVFPASGGREARDFGSSGSEAVLKWTAKVHARP